MLTAWLTGLALAGIAAAVLLLGGPDGLHATLRDMVAQVLDRISIRITNEVAGINRVVVDVSNKPPSTIEWE